MSIEAVQKTIIPIFQKYGVTKASIFGSVARGEDTAESDIDMLVNLRRPFSLARFVALKRGLEAALQKTVDIVEYEAVRPAFAERILKDSKVIYEQ